MSSRLVAETARPRTVVVPGVSTRWPSAGLAVPSLAGAPGAETASTLGDLTWPAERRLLLDCLPEFFESMISTAEVSVWPEPAPALARPAGRGAPPLLAWSLVS